MIYMSMPYHNNPCPIGHEIYNFGRPFLGPILYTQFYLIYICPGVEKILKEIHELFAFDSKIIYP